MNNNVGYIYILYNPSIEGMVKIGRTFRQPEERMKEISNVTGVPTPFILIDKVLVYDCVKAELAIHQVLESKGKRVAKNREFFNLSIPESIKIVQEICSAFPTDLLDKKEKKGLEYNEEQSYNFSNRNILQDMIDEGESYIYGLNGSLKDVKKGISILEKAGKGGSAKANFLCGRLYLSRENEINHIKNKLKKALAYFTQGAECEGIEAGKCNAEMALIYSGYYKYEDYSNLLSNHNASISWNSYIEKINIHSFTELDKKYLIALLKNELSTKAEVFSKNNSLYETSKKLLSSFNWIKYEIQQYIDLIPYEEDEHTMDLFGNEVYEEYLSEEYPPKDFLEAFMLRYFIFPEKMKLSNGKLLNEPRSEINKIKIQINKDVSIVTGDILKITGDNSVYVKVEEELEKSFVDQSKNEVIYYLEINKEINYETLMKAEKLSVIEKTNITVSKVGEDNYNKKKLSDKEADNLVNYLLSQWEEKFNLVALEWDSPKAYYEMGIKGLGPVSPFRDSLGREPLSEEEKKEKENYFKKGLSINGKGSNLCMAGLARLDLDSSELYWNKYFENIRFNEITEEDIQHIFHYTINILYLHEEEIKPTQKILTVLGWVIEDLFDRLESALKSNEKEQMEATSLETIQEIEEYNQTIYEIESFLSSYYKKSLNYSSLIIQEKISNKSLQFIVKENKNPIKIDDILKGSTTPLLKVVKTERFKKNNKNNDDGLLIVTLEEASLYKKKHIDKPWYAYSENLTLKKVGFYFFETLERRVTYENKNIKKTNEIKEDDRQILKTNETQLYKQIKGHSSDENNYIFGINNDQKNKNAIICFEKFGILIMYVNSKFEFTNEEVFIPMGKMKKDSCRMISRKFLFGHLRIREYDPKNIMEYADNIYSFQIPLRLPSWTINGLFQKNNVNYIKKKIRNNLFLYTTNLIE